MIGSMTRSRLVAWAICVVGFALVAAIIFVEADVPDDDVAAFAFFSLAFVVSPWLIFAAFCRRWESDRGVIAAGALLLAFELYIYHDVFVDPKSSTAPLAYIFKPFIQVLLLLPLGLGMGWVGDKWAAESKDAQ